MLAKGLFVTIILLISACGEIVTDAEYLQRAKKNIEDGKSSAAILELKNALQQNAQNTEARLLLGKIYVNADQGSAAEKELRKAVELGVPKREVAYELGKALLQQGKYQQILTEVDVSGQSEAKMLAIEALYGWAYLGLEDFLKAKSVFDNILSRNEKNIDALQGMSRISLGLNKYDESLDYINQALGYEDNAVSWLLHAEIMHAKGNDEKAEESYGKALELKPNYMQALAGRAANRIALEKYDEARSDVKQVMKSKSSVLAGNNLLGIIEFKEKSYQSALQNFTKVETNAEGFHSVKFWLALTNSALGNYEQARNYIHSFLAVYPDYQDAQKLLAFIEIKLANPAGAIKSLKKLETNDVSTLEMLATAYAISGDLGESVRYYKKIQKRNEFLPQQRAKYSFVLAQEGRIKEALDEMQSAVELDDSLGSLEYKLILQLIKSGDVLDANARITKLLEKKPDDARLHELKGILHFRESDLFKAKESFKQAMSLDDKRLSIYHNLARIAFQENKPVEANAYYNKALKINPQHVPTMLAIYFLEEGQDYRKAQRKLEKFIKSNPESVLPRIILARRYLDQRMTNQALELVKVDVSNNNLRMALLEIEATAHMQQNETGLAISAFEKIAKEVPGNSNIFFNLAQAYSAKGDTFRTREYLEKVVKQDPRNLQAFSALIRLSILENKIKEAEQLLTKLEKLDNGSASLFLKYDLLMKQKKYNQAANTIKPSYITQTNNSSIALKYLRALWLANKKKQSLTECANWLAKNPESEAILSFQAQAYQEVGDKQNAIRSYERIIRLKPNSAVSLNNLAWELQDDDLSRALANSKKAYELESNVLSFADTYGFLLYKSGKYEEAISVLTDALREGKGSPEIKFHLAQVYCDAGHKQQCRDLLEKVVSGQSFEGIGKARKLLKSAN